MKKQLLAKQAGQEGIIKYKYDSYYSARLVRVLNESKGERCEISAASGCRMRIFLIQK